MSTTGLKDFQQRTVDWVAQRLLDEGARRFLVADEVGLGKTLVARGVVERAVAHLRDSGVKRVDVVYVCSNQEIAKQNLKRLQIDGHASTSLPSRITLLPLHLEKFQTDGVNFVSLTPGTSFDPRSRGGWTQERALLLRLLRPVWNIPRHRGVYEVFRLDAKVSSLKNELRALSGPDPGIAAAFAAKMLHSPLRAELFALMDAANRRAGLPATERDRQLHLIGALRRELARCCVDALEPDLVILDEFQRFSKLLDGESDAAELAQQLFSFGNDRGEFARVLLLSATPYRSFSHAGEDGSAHHTELRRLLTFLYEDEQRADAVERSLRALREQLVSGTAQVGELERARADIEAALTSVMVRTERLASSATRNGMLTERQAPALKLDAGDVRGFARLAALHGVLRDRGILRSGAAVTELWKSSPWLAQFMEEYKFKHAIDDAVERPNDGALADALAGVREDLDWKAFRSYEPLHPGNPRLRSLATDSVDQLWDLLWIPPSMPYHRPGPPFLRLADRPPTKRLIFSSWTVVPRTIAGYLSYEAERHVHRALDAAADNSPEARRANERRLLDFKLDRSEGEHPRPSSMTTLSFLAPSAALAEVGDPRMVGAHDELLTPAEVVRQVRTRVDALLEPLSANVDPALPASDPRWYWAAPLLLDRERADARSFWSTHELVATWAGDGAGGTENFSQHVMEARSVINGGVTLGSMPNDLAEVLAHLAVAAPATVAARSLLRVLPEVPSDGAMLAAARVGWGWRHVFNSPEGIAAVEATQPKAAYWRQALSYALNGGLQAVMDEWMHLMAEDAGAGLRGDTEVLEDVVARVALALGLGASRVEVDPLDRTSKVPWRTHFAMRYGQSRDEGSRQSIHAEAVRRAFNSPLRPFVLASTSVGQEGLDFHPYCHAIVHWNLPTNPVDLEQREGRVHRYKGHAVRKNVAARFGASAVHSGATDPWAEAFAAAKRARPSHQDDLVPFWIQPGRFEIERYVPAIPFSRDAERYARVRRQVTLYRMVFGQPRQDDLIAYLQDQLGQAEAERLAELVRIDLSPRARASAA